MRLINADKLAELHPEIADLLVEAETVDAIVLPYKPGDNMWYIATEDGYKIKMYDEVIHGVAYYGDGRFEMISADGEHSTVGEHYCCISIEQAKEVRQKMLSQLTLEDVEHSIKFGRKCSPKEWEPFLEEVKELFLKKVDSLS